MKQADIPHRRMYETRHTFATTMLSRGILKPYDLSRILGHANTQMVYSVYVQYVDGLDVVFDQDIDLYSGGTNLGTMGL